MDRDTAIILAKRVVVTVTDGESNFDVRISKTETRRLLSAGNFSLVFSEASRCLYLVQPDGYGIEVDVIA